jgi:predicted nucleotidyltransferase
MKSYEAIYSIDPDMLRTEYGETILATYLVGSQAYGTATPESDKDYRGIFILPKAAYLSISEAVGQVSDERNNTTYYTLKRFLELAASANPNIIEMLFMPQDCRVFESPLMQRLLERRDIFITKQAYTSHISYASAQIKRARGQNKWVNNPQPEKKPSELDFCWFVPRETAEHQFPYRPVHLRKSGVDLSFCSCAAMEQTGNTYRLYRYDAPTRGVFRNGMLVCESIPKADENSRCIGLLIYNRTERDRASRDHDNYWVWRKHRNDARWQSQERDERDYDAKNMMHTFRLLLSGENILKHGVPLVRFEGEQLQTLLDIRNGKYPYDELIRMVDARYAKLHETLKISQHTETADRAAIDRLFMEITLEWEAIYES